MPILTDYFKFCGLKLPDFAAQDEAAQRPLFSMDEQLDMLQNPEKLKKWLQSIGTFFVEQKRFSQKELDDFI